MATQVHSPRRLHGLDARLAYVIGLLWVVNIFNYMDRTALSILLPFIKQEMTLSDSQLGLLVGFAFSLFYAICGIPVARLADTGTRKSVIAAALAIWSVMTALTGAAQSFWHLFAARIGVGAGEAGCIPPAQSLLCDHVPRARRGAVMAFHNSGIFVGTMLSMGIAGWLGEMIGWRWTFVALGAPGIVLALIVWLTIAEPERGRLDEDAAGLTGVRTMEALRLLAANRAFLIIVAFYVINGFAQYGLLQWWPSFYARAHDLGPAIIGVPLGLAIGVGCGIGLLLGAIAALRFGERDARRPILIGAMATLFAFPAALASLFVDSADLSVTMVGLTCVLWSVSNGPIIAALYNVCRPDIRTTAGAVPIFFAAILGFGPGPFTVGLLSDHFNTILGNDGLRFAMIAPSCAIPLIALALFAVSRSIDHQGRNIRVVAPAD